MRYFKSLFASWANTWLKWQCGHCNSISLTSCSGQVGSIKLAPLLAGSSNGEFQSSTFQQSFLHPLPNLSSPLSHCMAVNEAKHSPSLEAQTTQVCCEKKETMPLLFSHTENPPLQSNVTWCTDLIRLDTNRMTFSVFLIMANVYF